MMMPDRDEVGVDDNKIWRSGPLPPNQPKRCRLIHPSPVNIDVVASVFYAIWCDQSVMAQSRLQVYAFGKEKILEEDRIGSWL